MICPPIVAPYRLGTLCKRGHDHAGTGMSIRYVPTRSPCKLCLAESSRVWSNSPSGRRSKLASMKKHRVLHPGRHKTTPSVVKRTEERRIAREERLRVSAGLSEERRARHTARGKAWCERNPEKRLEISRRSREKHLAARKAAARSYKIAGAAAAVPPGLRCEREKIYEFNSALQRIYRGQK